MNFLGKSSWSPYDKNSARILIWCWRNLSLPDQFHEVVKGALCFHILHCFLVVEEVGEQEAVGDDVDEVDHEQDVSFVIFI